MTTFILKCLLTFVCAIILGTLLALDTLSAPGTTVRVSDISLATWLFLGLFLFGFRQVLTEVLE